MSETPQRGLTTSARLTPEQLASNAWTRDFLYRLQQQGYVVVHPEDVPPWGDRNEWTNGWNACRSRIFGGDDE